MPSLLEALERKYGSGISATALDDLPVAIFVPKRSPRLSVPTLLVLNDCDIDSAGDPSSLDDKCADVEELDLAKNVLSKWDEVFSVLKHMPNVKFVNLSFNQLGAAGLIGPPPTNVILEHLSNLVLNSTRVSWRDVTALLKVLPVLEELHLSLNDYSTVNLSEVEERCKNCSRLLTQQQPVHSKLTKLHFSGNPVKSCSEVIKLGYAFPHLDSLLLNECTLTSLKLEEPCPVCQHHKILEVHEAFRQLRFLNLNNTGLGTWDEVDRLAQFPALRSLRVQGWPLWERCEATEHERRLLLLARLPKVSTLNGGGLVPDDERDTAERAFIRYYMDRPEADRPDRYWELVNVHGKLDPLVSVDLRPEKRVKVTFTFGDSSELRTVDVYRTVSDLKVRLERLAGLPASKMRLFYIDQDLRDHYQGPEEMKYPTKRLYSYNIRSGDEIIIDSKH